MKTDNYIMYVVAHKDGATDTSSLSLYKTDCIKKFMRGSGISWIKHKSNGWYCKKVEISIRYNNLNQ